MSQKAPRITDVARLAGVSTATVSRALSKPETVAESTRDAVLEAARESGYRVNLSARNLRRQRTGAIVILVPDLGNPFFSRILSGIEEGL
ncbi:MAG: LacI family DNA-binding transcriptional regulator, partial [Hoeflea sp.]